ncbi:MAG: hypothetical protein FWE19_05200 [Oscillospiraceae bacterium]|nr:hypothetical protein [Oscillospiraceae bacterium]
MIYITGDMHGDIDRFSSRELRRLKKGDTLIICGDFGFAWEGTSKEERLLKWIGKRRYNTLFVEGANDNLALLNSYPQVEWQGGKIREISGRLRLICRGEVLEIEGKKIFAFGGGAAEYEITDSPNQEGGELPSPQEIENARRNLEGVDYKVDYIVTHKPSSKIRQFLMLGADSADILDTFLNEVREKCKYTRWFFGSIHKNKRIPPNEMAVFTAVVPVDGDL